MKALNLSIANAKLSISTSIFSSYHRSQRQYLIYFEAINVKARWVPGTYSFLVLLFGFILGGLFVSWLLGRLDQFSLVLLGERLFLLKF